MKGFTLIELIITIVLIGVLFGAGAANINELGHSFGLLILRKDLGESAETAIRRMSREIRRVANSISVTTANGTTYRFTDIDGTDIEYSLSGGVLNRTIGGVTTDGLADNVTSLTFTYYDSNGNTIAVPAVSPSATNIRRAQIDFTISDSGHTLNFRSQVRLMRLICDNDLFA